jgi:hypothetical protein
MIGKPLTVAAASFQPDRSYQIIIMTVEWQVLFVGVAQRRTRHKITRK